MNKPTYTKTYIFTLVATLAVFAIAFGFSAYFNGKKTRELKDAEDKIAINILSLETQYDLLKESSCKSFDRKTLREELDSLYSKLTYMENQVSKSNQEVPRLKQYYALLQIKDYLLTKKMSEQCNLDSIFVLYFYSKNNCAICQTQEYLLRAVRNQYPQAEIYYFDYDQDFKAVQAMVTLHDTPSQAPFLHINGKTYAHFTNLEGIQTVLATHIKTATTTATTTIKKVKNDAR